MVRDFPKDHPGLYTPTISRRKRNNYKEKFILFYDFSSFISIDFRKSLNEHLADYDEYIKKREKILKYDNPENWREFYPPLVQHFINTFFDNYDFLRYMLYLYNNIGKDEMEVYLITGTDFSEEEKDLIVKCLQKCCIRTQSIEYGSHDDISSTIKGLLTFSSRDKLISDINEIRDNATVNVDENNDYHIPGRDMPYLLISGNDYSDVFGRHSMIPEKDGVIVNLNYQRAHYLLFGRNGEIFSTKGYETNPKFYGDRIIFLDIDGVLNRNGNDESGKHEYYNEGMVKELSYLVKKTGAKIILSSSWRSAFIDHIKGYENIHEEIFTAFLNLLERENIHIYGMTPNGGMQGCATRPLEIRTWLATFPEIESFVILDDDTVWNWGYLRQNVVTTTTLLSEDEKAELKKTESFPKNTRDGLTRELADKAAEILLRNHEACIMDSDDC